MWTRNRQDLLKDATNAASIDVIERSAFIVCLDDTNPVTKDEISRACWHGEGRNRYFDKALQFIVFDNGKAGFNGEHSMMDATPTHRLCEFVCEGIAKNSFKTGPPASKLAEPPQLAFHLSSNQVAYIQTAETTFAKIAEKEDLRVVSFEAFGKNAIKKWGVSPDGFAQMAIQLAYYKMYGKCGATYESAQTKKFAYGRTETCRSVSVESVEWTKAMSNPELSLKTKGMLGRKAIYAQGAYMADCVEGRGVDRHFLGI